MGTKRSCRREKTLVIPSGVLAGLPGAEVKQAAGDLYAAAAGFAGLRRVIKKPAIAHKALAGFVH